MPLNRSKLKNKGFVKKRLLKYLNIVIYLILLFILLIYIYDYYIIFIYYY